MPDDDANGPGGRWPEGLSGAFGSGSPDFAFHGGDDRNGAAFGQGWQGWKSQFDQAQPAAGGMPDKALPPLIRPL